MKMINETIDYYNCNADQFVKDTVDAEMNELHAEFLKYIPARGKILDLGCGSGRDSRFFIDRGYRVISVDGSVELCRKTEELTGQKAVCSTFMEYTTEEKFDGIWACASLLHLKTDECRLVVNRLAGNLVNNGCFYMSFKYGFFEGMRNKRYFNDMTDERFQKDILEGNALLKIVHTFKTTDVRPGRGTQIWLNEFLIRTDADRSQNQI